MIGFLSFFRLATLDGTQELVQALEALFPVAAVLVHPVRDVPQRACPQPSRTPLRVAALLDEPGPLEHPEVLGDGRLTHVEGFRQVLDRCLALGEAGPDGPPCRGGEGGASAAYGGRPLH